MHDFVTCIGRLENMDSLNQAGLLNVGIFHYFNFFCLFAFSRADPAAYGGSQARGLMGAVAAGLRQSHSNVGSKLRLRPIPQFTAMLDPQPTEQGQGPNPKPHGS